MVQLVPVLALTLFVVIFGLLIVIGSSLLGPKTKQSKMKSDSYECGLPGTDVHDTKIPIRFYLTAILFIIFDIEIIFMYPWALAFGDFIEAGHGTYIFASMAVFIFIFIFGLFWEVKSRALEWE